MASPIFKAKNAEEFDAMAKKLLALKKKEADAVAERIGMEQALIDFIPKRSRPEEGKAVVVGEKFSVDVVFTIDRKADPADFTDFPEAISGSLFRSKVEFSKSGQNQALLALETAAALDPATRPIFESFVQTLHDKVLLISRKPTVTPKKAKA